VLVKPRSLRDSTTGNVRYPGFLAEELVLAF
jgi:hypothetical protein